jgi:hypothetical protein
MQLKNDNERRKFLDSYRDGTNGWKLWKSDEEMERRWWRNDSFKDVTLIVEEECRTYLYPEEHSVWTVLHWYAMGAVVPAGARWKNHFGDFAVSKTAMMGILKLQEHAERGA